MKTFLQKIIKRINKFFNLSSSEKDDNNTGTNTKVRLNELYEDIPDPSVVFKDTLGMQDIDRDGRIPENLKKILLEIENMGDRLRKFGESDGPYQMKYKTIKTITGNTAERVSKYIETIFKGISESIKSESEVKKEEESRINKDLDISKKYLEELKKDKHWRPKNYLLWEAILFSVFGLALLMGDVVLSLSGTKEAFLLQDWEKWAMSIGITACTIYIKVYYDEHILPAIERSVTMFNPENLKGIKDDSSKPFLIKIWKNRFIFKTALLVVVIGSIYLLGELRFQVISDINPSISKYGFSRPTFVLLSALFPIIGGVCMAMAIKKIRSYGILRKARDEEEEIRLRLYEVQKELSVHEQDLENCATYIDWSANDKFIENLTQFLFACYMHGYEYAFRKHNAQLDILEKAKEIRRLFSGDSAQLNKEYPF